MEMEKGQVKTALKTTFIHLILATKKAIQATMKSISVTPPEWAKRIPEDVWIAQLMNNLKLRSQASATPKGNSKGMTDAGVCVCMCVEEGIAAIMRCSPLRVP